MTSPAHATLILLGLALIACAPGPALDDAGPGPEDGGGVVDAGPACGALQPEIAQIRGTEGLVVDAAGTLYFSQNASIGRMGADGVVEASFVALPGAQTVWGLQLSAAEDALFVGSPSTSLLYRVDLEDRSVTSFSQTAPNGFAIDAAGTVFFSDFSEGTVSRIEGGVPVPVTSATIAGANGLAFTPTGTLLVAGYSSGQLFELTLSGGNEAGRAVVASNLGNPDGVALDEDGRIYITDNTGGTLVRFARGEAPETLLSGMSAPASIAFGRGPLACTDIFVANLGPLRRFVGDASGQR